MDNIFTYKEPMTCIFYATPNAQYKIKKLNVQINVNILEE